MRLHAAFSSSTWPTIEPSVSGPKRPQDRIALGRVKSRVAELLRRNDATGFARSEEDCGKRVQVRMGGPEASQAGGGDQDIASVPDGRAKGTSTLTETEMMNNRPTPKPCRPPTARRDAPP